MKRFGIIVITAAAVLGFTTALMAAQQTAKPARVSGQITKIDGKALTITTTNADKQTIEVVVNCTDSTRYSRDGDRSGTQVTFADLKVGQSVRTYYNQPSNAAINVLIAVPPPPPAKRITGQLTKIDGKTITITTTVDNTSTDTSVICTDTTKLRRDGGNSSVMVKFEELKVGQNVRAYYSPSDGTASLVAIAATQPADAAPAPSGAAK